MNTKKKSKNGEVLGAALKTSQTHSENDGEYNSVLYVSSGHRISLDTALKIVFLTLDEHNKYRLPLPTEFADRYTREIMREYEAKTKSRNRNISNKGLLNQINQNLERINRQKYIQAFGKMMQDDTKQNNHELIIFKHIKTKDNVTWSALCIVPPQSIWGPIQKIREVNDKNYKRWMPHINIFFPYIKPNIINADEVSKAIYRTFKKHNIKANNIIQLNRFNSFNKGHNSNDDQYIFLETSNVPFLNKLYKSLRIVFPNCHINRDHNIEYKPHLTVGQWPGKKCKNMIRLLNHEWTPIQFKLQKIYWIRRNKNDSFKKYKEFNLI